MRSPRTYSIGFFHIDIAEVRTEEGKLYLFVAIDRTSKVAFARLLEKANTATAVTFLDELIEAIPYKINVVLTDNGIQFADLPKNRSGPTATWRRHPFDRACQRHGIEHRLTKPNHPWTNGQVERMNRTLKEATVQRYYYESHEQLRAHLADFLAAYNFANRLKTLRPHTARICLQDLDRRPGSLQARPNPSHHGTVRCRMVSVHHQVSLEVSARGEALNSMPSWHCLSPEKPSGYRPLNSSPRVSTTNPSVSISA